MRKEPTITHLERCVMNWEQRGIRAKAEDDLLKCYDNMMAADTERLRIEPDPKVAARHAAVESDSKYNKERLEALEHESVVLTWLMWEMPGKEHATDKEREDYKNLADLIKKESAKMD